jgi:tellurite resistance protein TehA-like permease
VIAGVVVGLRGSSNGLRRWCEVVGGYVSVFGRVCCVVGNVEYGVGCGVDVVCVAGYGVGGVLVVVSIVVGVRWGIVGVVGGVSMYVM